MTEDNQITYTKKSIAFLDILGFENLVNASREDPEAIQKIYTILNQAKVLANSYLNHQLKSLSIDQTQYSYQQFSDTVIISGPHSSHHDFLFLTMWVMMYQFLLFWYENTFTRGGITYGNLYNDATVIFGPALVDAYHLESDSDRAVWPRVLIDESILTLCTPDEIKEAKYQFIKETNGMLFLDYLREWFHQSVYRQNKRIIGEISDDLGEPDSFFQKHREAIYSQVLQLKPITIKKDKERILKKYQKLAEYHNDTISQYCIEIDHLIGNKQLLKDYYIEQNVLSSLSVTNLPIKPKFNAQEHPELSIMLDILATVINKLVITQPEDVFDKHRIILSGNMNAIANTRVMIMFEKYIPKYLQDLQNTLIDSKIDVNALEPLSSSE